MLLMNSHATQLIDALGGTAAVARIFDARMPSISNWKRDGIPPARMMFLQVAYKNALAGIDLKAATAPRRPNASSITQPTTRESTHG